MSTRTEVFQPAALSASPRARQRAAMTSRRARVALDELSPEWKELLATPIEFVDHSAFHQPGFERTCLQYLASDWCALGVDPPLPRNAALGEAARPDAAFLLALGHAPLLTPDQEQHLFQQMNGLKFQAEQWRLRLNSKRPNHADISRLETSLAAATGLRNQIIRANLRLIIAVAKTLSRSQDQLSELVSEGFAPLLRAVELFNVERGFRFSTYATWAVRNRLHRVLQQTRRQATQAKCQNVLDWQKVPDRRQPEESSGEPPINHGQALSQLLDSLTPRERRVIESRFGLGCHPAGLSYAAISAEFGLSKERIRQIVAEALGKLRELAVQNPELVGQA